jgi:hypothetical protein
MSSNRKHVVTGKNDSLAPLVVSVPGVVAYEGRTFPLGVWIVIGNSCYNPSRRVHCHERSQ